jgi:hypothetical protein
MTRKLSRRLGVLERTTTPPTAAPCLVRVESRADADREVTRVRAAYPDSKCSLFVMVCSAQRCGNGD